MDDHRFLRIFLSERLILMRGGRDLARRMRDGSHDPAWQAPLDAAVAELEQGSATLTSFLRQIGSGPPRLRLRFVSVAERLGRLKSNGRAASRSPLSDLEELDALTTVVRCSLAAWAALDRADVADVETVRARLSACESLAACLERLRLASAKRAFGTVTPSPMWLDNALDALTHTRDVARWGAGLSLASWRYATRRVPIDRQQQTVPGADNGPVDREVAGDQAGLQPRSDGDGASMRRRYRVNVANPHMTPTELIGKICGDPNVAAPFEVARFVKTSGRLGEMMAGDEYLVWMPGPWNGPVRVADRTPTSFRLATLDGHMEAGEIEFRARSGHTGLLFEIESAARSGSRTFRALYGPLWLAKEAQLHMWASFCERVARLAGDPATVIEVRSRRFPDDHGHQERISRRAERALANLQDRVINFEMGSLEAASSSDGWVVDDHITPLGREPSGDPIDDGPFAVARGLVRDYEFADPDLIRAIYDPTEPLEDRNMLLEGRFLGLRFLLGVRVVRVVDDTRVVDGRSVRRWGWSYRTLAGHLEVGQIDFEVLKWSDSGEVEFHIHAVSRPATITNPIVRLGFRIFGRRLQLRFARVAGERMTHLVNARLAGETGRDGEQAAIVEAVESPRS